MLALGAGRPGGVVDGGQFADVVAHGLGSFRCC
jgi:hypothetical protein